ncbi:MAG TPA: Imm50 family immunity protein [Caballeronia sp.]|jgi:hypothetical protein|nr:Imm50 family immunity protein [Caballeronia sp.]
MGNQESSDKTCVENSAIVRSVYGYWPSFHDAEVVEFRLKMRKEDRNVTDASIKILHEGQDNPQWTCPGPKCIVEFECADISNAVLDVSELYGGNWISRLIVLKKSEHVYEFDLQSSAGLEVKLTCKAISVAAIYSAA